MQPTSKIPRTVWALGFVSMFMDISSETIHSLLPLFLTGTLGVSVAMVGLIDGVAESTASIAKLFSGYVSDRMGRRKPLILIGYGMGALTKPLFAVAGSAPLVITARFADRIGKGLRGAPRDALVADVTPLEIRGRAFGLRQSLDTMGALIGPLVAIGLMFAFANNIRSVFWVTTIPAIISVLLVLLFVSEPRSLKPTRAARSPIEFADLKRLPRTFWLLTMVGAIFTLARFSEAFLILKASSEGLPLALAPVVLVVMNAVYVIGAYPAGAVADRFPARTLLSVGMVCLIMADLALALLPSLTGAFIGIALWGAHMALTQGLLTKLVADNVPPELRGSAYGFFNFGTGIALLFASLIAGIVWDRFGAEATFLVGAGFAVVALGALLTIERQ